MAQTISAMRLTHHSEIGAESVPNRCGNRLKWLWLSSDGVRQAGNEGAAFDMASDVTSRAVRDGYKRTFDLCVVSLAGVVFAPLWLFLAVVIPLAIWLEDRGPVFFKQPRIGLGGKVFYMVKFRSMAPRAQVEANAAGIELEIALDRLTSVGKLLRLFHLTRYRKSSTFCEAK